MVTVGAPRRGQVLLAVAGLSLGLVLLGRSAEGVAPGDLIAALGRLGPGQWGLAAFGTAVSLWSMGRLDLLVHRWLGTGVDGPRARRAGTVAVAISQTAGFGILSGALARWRALPELDLWRASLVALVSSLGFLAASGMLLLSALALREGNAAALAGLLLVAAALARAGALRGAAAALTITALDTGMAALVLWSVWDGGPGAGFATFWAAYLIALWAGLVSQSPGGVGVFEATLIALLPGGATPEAFAAFLAYRAVYHLVPALLAPLALVRPGPAPDRHLGPAGQALTGRLSAAPADGDWALLSHGGSAVSDPLAGTIWHRRALPGQVLTLGEPLGRPDWDRLRRFARAEGRPLACYRLTGRTAVAARAAGWSVVRVGREAIVDVARWRTDGAVFRQLRRKLAGAARAGVTVEVRLPGASLPIAEMRRVHDSWVAVHGGERGLVMGRFAPEPLGRQAVLLARSGDRLVAFASFHVTATGWGLDLMRAVTETPAGTMHLLVATAITTAREAEAWRLSLASVPEPAHPLGLRLTARTRRGLDQFKESFGPTWRPRYAVAPTGVELALGLLRVLGGTLFPGRLQPRHGSRAPLRVVLGEFRFEFAPGPCDPNRESPARPDAAGRTSLPRCEG